MPTLWEILTGKVKKEVPPELQIYNPLGLLIGNSINIDTLDTEKLGFTLDSLREVKRTVENTVLKFADYLLVAKPYNADTVVCRLRLVPLADEAGISHKALLLKKLGDCLYDKDFHEGLAYERNQGEWTEGEATYWRVDDVKSEWNAEVSNVVGRGKQRSNAKLTYWDFWRETQDEGGNTVLEFYFVEMDAESGYFEFWLGKEIDPSRVAVL